MDTRGIRQLGLALGEASSSEVQANQGRRAGGVDTDAGPAEAKSVAETATGNRDSVGGGVEGAALSGMLLYQASIVRARQPCSWSAKWY